MESTVVLTGYVGHDVEVKMTRTGVPMVAFRVGTTPRMRVDGTWVDAATTWSNVTCYRGLAENVARSLAKGDPVFVQGRVRTQAWVDDAGAHHEKTVIEATVIGHDLNRGTSSFCRNSLRIVDDRSLVLDGADQVESSGSPVELAPDLVDPMMAATVDEFCDDSCAEQAA
ncbi:MAG: single-stranded DNA-binding protein [Propionibacteriaceae bacterium]|jgi:single-strand DNA-binding protein|nr:single-stranded DNA-binding protein [Propionibacteriaceae bacterium]